MNLQVVEHNQVPWLPNNGRQLLNSSYIIFLCDSLLQWSSTSIGLSQSIVIVGLCLLALHISFEHHRCNVFANFLCAAGDIVCSWGRGEDGQLGHGDADERHFPTIISSLEDCEISSITCGADHTIARSDARATVYSWGW